MAAHYWQPAGKAFLNQNWRRCSNHGNESGQKLLAEIKKNPRIGRRELSAILGMGEKVVRTQIEILKKNGLLKRIGPDRGGHWEVVA